MSNNVDFSALLKRPAGEAEKPLPLPIGDYPAIVKAYEVGTAKNENKTPYVRFQIGLLGWPESVDESERLTKGGNQIDLSKRTFRRDYYMTTDALWRFDEFLRTTGVTISGRTYEEILPEIIGCQVTATISQYLNERSNELGNQVEKLFGPESPESGA